VSDLKTEPKTLCPKVDLPALLTAIPDPRVQPTLTVPVAGGFLGLGRDSAYNAAKRGEIPTIRIGRRLVVPTAALLTLLGISDEA